METVVGTCTVALEVPRRMRTPPCGAAFDSVTLHCVESPPATAGDWQETRDSEAGAAGAVTVNVTVFLVAPRVAATVALPVRLDTVEKLNPVLVVPIGIVADDGTRSPGLLDERETVVGVPELVIVIVQVPPVPATTVVGLQVSDLRRAGANKERVVFTDELP